jgi:hypothetical protein
MKFRVACVSIPRKDHSEDERVLESDLNILIRGVGCPQDLGRQEVTVVWFESRVDVGNIF